MSISSLGKAFIIIGFFFLLIVILYHSSYQHSIASSSLVVAAFFFVVGWVLATEQLVYTSLAGKIGVFMISISIMSLVLAAVCSTYNEIGKTVYEVEVSRRTQELSAVSEVQRKETHMERYCPDTKMEPRLISFHPYALISFPLAIFGTIILVSGLFLKLHYGGYDLLKEQPKLSYRKHFAFSLTLLFVGICLVLLGSISSSYATVYAEFSSGELTIPSAYEYAYDMDQQVNLLEYFPQYVDFPFRPWFNCRYESHISVPSSSNVTLLVFEGDVSEPIVNLTSNDIRCSVDLSAKTQYLFSIKNAINTPVSVVTSTKIDAMISEKAGLIGTPFIVAGGVTTIVLAGKELKKRKEKHEQPNRPGE
jgi:hypothetical protein